MDRSTYYLGYGNLPYDIPPSAAQASAMATPAESEYYAHIMPDRSTVGQSSPILSRMQQARTESSILPSATGQRPRQLPAQGVEEQQQLPQIQTRYAGSPAARIPRQLQVDMGAPTRPAATAAKQDDPPYPVASTPPRPLPRFAIGDEVSYTHCDMTIRGIISRLVWNASKNRWQYNFFDRKSNHSASQVAEADIVLHRSSLGQESI